MITFLTGCPDHRSHHFPHGQRSHSLHANCSYQVFLFGKQSVETCRNLSKHGYVSGMILAVLFPIFMIFLTHSFYQFLSFILTFCWCEIVLEVVTLISTDVPENPGTEPKGGGLVILIVGDFSAGQFSGYSRSLLDNNHLIDNFLNSFESSVIHFKERI